MTPSLPSLIFYALLLGRCLVQSQSFLDPSFGSSGTITTRLLGDDPPVNHLERLFAVVTVDNDIIACGSTSYPSRSYVLPFCLRLREDGSRLPSFGGGVGITPNSTANRNGEFRAVFLDASDSLYFFAVGSDFIFGQASATRWTLICRFHISSGAEDFCTRTSRAGDTLSVSAADYSATEANSLVVLSYTRPINFFVLETFSKTTGAFKGTVFTGPSAPKTLVGDLALLPGGLLAVASGIVDGTGNATNATVHFIPANGTLLPYAVQLPLQDDAGTVMRFALGDGQRLFCCGNTGRINFFSNTSQAAVWALVYDPALMQFKLDTSWADAGALILPNSFSFPIFGNSITYDGAFRLVIGARRLQRFDADGLEINNNDLILYRPYSFDGRADASFNYQGEVVATTSLSEDVLTSTTDLRKRVIGVGSRNIILGSTSSPATRRDDAFLLRTLSSIGNCTLGGPSCTCSSDQQCSYVGFVFSVQNATARPSLISGKFEIASNVTISAAAPLQSTGVFLNVVNGPVLIQSGATLAVNLSGNGTFVLVQSVDSQLIGTFADIVITTSDSSLCSSAPQYSGSSLSVTVSLCPSSNTGEEGLSTGAIVGIAVGGSVACVLVVAGLALLAKHLVTHRTATMNRRLVKEEGALGRARQVQLSEYKPA